MKKVFLALGVLALGILACNSGGERTLNLYPTEVPNSTPTPLVIQITTTPNPTYTPVVVVVTETPNELVELCVVASESVYLRTQPDMAHDAILPLPKGTRVLDTGTRDGNWYFVEYGDKTGWINSDFLEACDD